jgi:hypothetical protein
MVITINNINKITMASLNTIKRPQHDLENPGPGLGQANEFGDLNGILPS